jgi:transposase
MGTMTGDLFWLSEEQWQRIQPLLPTDVRGIKREDDRRVISGIVHVLKAGCRWSECPADYGPYTRIYNRFVRWARRGIWEGLFRELAEKGDPAELQQLIDATRAKAHRRGRLLAARREGATRRSAYSQLLRDA